MKQPQWIQSATRLWADLRSALSLPRVSIDLMHARSLDNDPFFARTTRTAYDEYTRRHPRFPLIRFLEYGLAMCRMPETYEAYWAGIDGSARRNVRKAVKRGYRFERIDYNARLDDISAILRSTTRRQGAMDADLLARGALPINDPPSRDMHHDYAYYGVLEGDTMVAYAGCFVAGEILMIHTIFGHADHQNNGVVPALINGIAHEIYQRYPTVRYYAYDKWFGASQTLRRFKRKFSFEPYRVHWSLS